MISLQGVSKSYAGTTKVLEKVHLELKRGDFIYIAGGSGAGKTSLLKMIATEEAPTSGTVSLFGVSLSATNPSALRSIRKLLGYVPQDVRLLPDLTVYENLVLALQVVKKRLSTAEMKGRIADLLDKIGLASKSDVPARLLSGGEAQKVAVARALVREPELIIADEPTGAQDRESTWILMDLLMKANQKGATVIVATHDREMIRRIRKPCAILKGSQLIIEDNACIL